MVDLDGSVYALFLGAGSLKKACAHGNYGMNVNVIVDGRS